MKQFGIRITLPTDDTMAAPHLIGPDWEGYRWYDSAEERDKAYREMLEQPPYYRRDEDPTQILTKVERHV